MQGVYRRAREVARVAEGRREEDPGGMQGDGARCTGRVGHLVWILGLRVEGLGVGA